MSATRTRQRSTAVRPRTPRRRGPPPLPPAPPAAVPPVGADLLRTEWREAFRAADSALHAAARLLPDAEVRGRAGRLRDERERTGTLLRSLARDQHASAAFLHRFLPPDQARKLLGLPQGVEALVFRLDGVIVASAAVHAAAWAETFDEFLSRRAEQAGNRFPLVHFHPRTDYVRHIHGKTRHEGVRAFLASRGIRLPEGTPDDAAGAETVHGLANRKNLALVRRLEQQGVSAFDGSRHFLGLAHDAGVRCAVVSASAHTYMILDRAGLTDFVDEVVDGSRILAEGLRPEPAPDWLLAACRELEVDPERAAVFETTPAGVAAGRAAGFAVVVGVDREGQPEELRAAGADVVLGGLADLLDRELAAWL